VVRYYMNLRYRDRLFVDEEGDELANEPAVLGHALDTARNLIANGRMNSIRNWRRALNSAVLLRPGGLTWVRDVETRCKETARAGEG
jgi:hypothetical protein